MSENTSSIAFPRAAARSWMEINVRPWIAATLLVVLATVAMLAFQLQASSSERRLIQSGTRVDAKVIRIGLAKERQAPRDEEVRVLLQYVDPRGGKTIESERLLHRKAGAMVSLEQILHVRIDPDSPSVWTERSEPVPLSTQITVPLMFMPLALLLFLFTWLQRSRVRRTLAKGQPGKASVTSIKQAALAPLSKQLGLVIEGADRRVRLAYWPTRNGSVAKGQIIDVVTDGSSIVLPIRSYQ